MSTKTLKRDFIPNNSLLTNLALKKHPLDKSYSFMVEQLPSPWKFPGSILAVEGEKVKIYSTSVIKQNSMWGATRIATQALPLLLRR